MEISKKILLPKNAFALADDEDVFLTLQLSRTMNDIKTERINNVFNVTKQYDLERQASLKFCIFGLIESKFADTNDLIIDVRDTSGLNLYLPKISNDCITGKTFSIKSFELTKDSKMSKNLYGKNKSAYSFLFEIKKSELDAMNAATISGGSIPTTRYIEVSIVDLERNFYFIQTIPYLYYDLDGNQVPFGSQTADIDDDGNVIEINNDFPFLYDRHWVRQYFDIPSPSFVYFPNPTVNLNENLPNENKISKGLSAATTQLQIAIDQPSIYGLEEATVIISSDNTIKNPNLDYVFNTQTVKWGVGEQFKTVDIEIFNDNFVENLESINLQATNLKYCVAKSDNTGMTVNIIDDDLPSQIRFVENAFTVKSNASALTVSYAFDKPLEVSGQSIVLYYTGGTDAVLGKDFILDINNPTSQEIVLNFNEGDISGSTTISLIDNNVYDLDKTIELFFKNPTQNISISNVGADVNAGQLCRITIKDSLITQFSSFIFLNNLDKRISAVKSYTGPDSNGNYYWNDDIKQGFSVANKYDIIIVNLGDDMIYNNKLIPHRQIVTKITFTAQTSGDTIIDLPSNDSFNANTKSYSKSNYQFGITSNETFSVLNQVNMQQAIDFGDINIQAKKDAGPIGSKQYFFTTKLKNFYLNYDSVSSACTVSNALFNPPLYSLVEESLTNNIVFLGYNPFGSTPLITNPNPTNSSVENTFESTKVATTCSQFLPFGFGALPNLPYKFKYININLRNLYPQSTPPFSGSYNKLKLHSQFSQNKPFSSTNLGFVKWTSCPKNTRQSMIFSILNNGDIPIQISGQTVNPSEKFYIRGVDQDFNSLSITLPANESYSKVSSAFTIANYITALENISYYTSSGQLSGNPISLVFDSTNVLGSGPLSATPSYFVTTEYGNVIVPTQQNYNTSTPTPLDCSSFDFENNARPIDLGVRGVLLNNSSSSFKRGYYLSLSGDLTYTCINNIAPRIPFKDLST